MQELVVVMCSQYRMLAWLQTPCVQSDHMVSYYTTWLQCGAGLSNIITSLTGAGLTGSYIFSQTLFSMRAGVHTKLHGWIIAGEAALVCDIAVPHHGTPLIAECGWRSCLCTA